MKKWIPACGKNRDPFVTVIGGRYYRVWSRPDEDGRCAVWIACADNFASLAGAEGQIAFRFPESGPFSREVWAPELHAIGGKCYIYAACDDGDNHNHRMYVLENGSADPLRPYTMHGKIAASPDKWAIDGTVANIGGRNYFIWSGWEGDVNTAQNLYIAPMEDPFTLSGERVCLSKPEYDWEKRGATGEPESPFINEGPFAFTENGRTYLLYSASGSWCEDYCIGLMTLAGDDPMKPESWVKAASPVLGRTPEAVGCGHCSVIKEGGKLLMFFHAWDRQEKEIRWNTVDTWMAEAELTEGTLLVL